MCEENKLWISRAAAPATTVPKHVHIYTKHIGLHRWLHIFMSGRVLLCVIIAKYASHPLFRLSCSLNAYLTNSCISRHTTLTTSNAEVTNTDLLKSKLKVIRSIGHHRIVIGVYLIWIFLIMVRSLDQPQKFSRG